MKLIDPAPLLFGLVWFGLVTNYSIGGFRHEGRRKIWAISFDHKTVVCLPIALFYVTEFNRRLTAMKKQQTEITNLRTYIASGFIFLIGAGLLIAAEKVTYGYGYLWIKSVISNLGGLLVASVAIAMLWELFSKRSFLDELLEKTGLAEDLRNVGITGISLNPVRGPEFPKLIKSSERLDIFVCYANTWRANFEKDLKILATKKNCRIRLIIPNPDNSVIMDDLAKRFNATDAATMRSRIMEAISEYKLLFASVNNDTLNFSIWIHNQTPLTSFYRFDRAAVITLYKHAGGRGETPTLIAERGGGLYSFIENEVDAMVKGVHPNGALATKIYPLI